MVDSSLVAGMQEQSLVKDGTFGFRHSAVQQEVLLPGCGNGLQPEDGAICEALV